MTEMEKSPAIGISLTMNVGNNAQAVLQTFVAQEASDKEANALLDRLFSLAARQKALGEIPELEEDLSKHKKTLAQFNEDLARVETDYETNKEKRLESIAKLTKDYEAEFEKAYETHSKSGRQGEFEPRGSVKSRLATYTAGINKIDQEMKKADAERHQAIEGLKISQVRYEAEIERLSADIAKRKALIG
jgi:hypothetical protein